MTNPYTPPDETVSESSLLNSILRVGIWIHYPLICLSLLMVCGQFMSIAFHTTFSVENLLDDTIWVTPVGTIGKEGRRASLPIANSFGLPSGQRGGFEVQAGERIEITYDCDDINFSEVVIEDEDGALGHVVANRNPTAAQYIPAPISRLVVMESSIESTSQEILIAAEAAKKPSATPRALCAIVAAPWLTYTLLVFAKRGLEKPISSTR